MTKKPKKIKRLNEKYLNRLEEVILDLISRNVAIEMYLDETAKGYQNWNKWRKDRQERLRKPRPIKIKKHIHRYIMTFPRGGCIEQCKCGKRKQ